jgi:rfaE bifunctional protein kinase chain/domain/rfaE bifunctional protein nucleotidyltransferase chain/domain
MKVAVSIRTSAAKVLSLEQASVALRSAQAAGERVVHCHGCFDIVHPGHIRHLQHARRQGDRLLVTITADQELAKGAARPLIPQELRAENLAELSCVDWVAINPRPTAAELLEAIHPDVYVKGAEYERNRDSRFEAEKAAIERHGGRVVFTSGDVIFSSTALIAAMEESGHPFQSRLRGLVEQHGISPEAIDAVVARFRGLRVMVIGEIIIDTYISCDRPEIAGESPVMTLRPIEQRSFDGGAAVIARHLAAMGAAPVLVTVLPRGPQGHEIERRLSEAGIEVRAGETDRPLVEKQRFLVGTQKVMKLDLGEPLVLDSHARQELMETAVHACGLNGACDACIVADFGQGLFTAVTLRALCGALRPLVRVLAGDVSGRRSNLLAMQGMDLLCPSEAEARDALHSYNEGLSAVVWRLLEATASGGAIITMGDDGLIAFERTADSRQAPGTWRTRLTAEHVPALSAFAVDALGCGDALLAAATLGRAAGTTPVIAAVLGSVAAAAQVQRLGNAVIGAADLRRGIARLAASRLAFSAQPDPGIVSPRGEPRARSVIEVAPASPAIAATADWEG